MLCPPSQRHWIWPDPLPTVRALQGSGPPPHSRPAGFPASLPCLCPSPSLPLQPRGASIPTFLTPLPPIAAMISEGGASLKAGLAGGTSASAPSSTARKSDAGRDADVRAGSTRVRWPHWCPAPPPHTRGLSRAAAAVLPTRILLHVLLLRERRSHPGRPPPAVPRAPAAPPLLRAT
jgi:hypothetical protein